jgi:hypothetical protein
MNSEKEGAFLYDVEIEDLFAEIRADNKKQARIKAVVGWRRAGYGNDGRWPRSIRARGPKGI